MAATNLAMRGSHAARDQKAASLAWTRIPRRADNVWVVANGTDTMELSEVFLRVGVALIGPGERGDFFDRRAEYEKLEPQELRILKDFCENAAVGERILLRRKKGRSSHEILAIGRIAGPYRHEPIFQEVDVHGWDLQHCRRVKWVEVTPPAPVSLPPNRFSRIADADIIKLADDLWATHKGP